MRRAAGTAKTTFKPVNQWSVRGGKGGGGTPGAGAKVFITEGTNFPQTGSERLLGKIMSMRGRRP